jgi:hypothetical protein
MVSLETGIGRLQSRQVDALPCRSYLVLGRTDNVLINNREQIYFFAVCNMCSIIACVVRS